VNQIELGQRIRQARERISMSQEKFAEAIERDQKAISEYETGKRKIAAIEMPHIAAVLGVPISYSIPSPKFRVHEKAGFSSKFGTS